MLISKGECFSKCGPWTTCVGTIQGVCWNGRFPDFTPELLNKPLWGQCPVICIFIKNCPPHHASHSWSEVWKPPVELVFLLNWPLGKRRKRNEDCLGVREISENRESKGQRCHAIVTECGHGDTGLGKGFRIWKLSGLQWLPSINPT